MVNGSPAIATTVGAGPNSFALPGMNVVGTERKCKAFKEGEPCLGKHNQSEEEASEDEREQCPFFPGVSGEHQFEKH